MEQMTIKVTIGEFDIGIISSFGTQKVLRKGKNTKKNYFLMFDSKVENVKENQI